MTMRDISKDSDGFFGIFAGLIGMMPEEIKALDIYADFYCKIYDYVSDPGSYDIDIYLEAAKSDSRGKKNILEFACGSGRILLPLVMNGHSVTGVDLSEDMLENLEKRTRYLAPGMQESLRVLHGNMAEIDLNEKFDVIILGACTICLLETPRQREAFFDNVRRHLAPGGVFIFDYHLHDPEKMVRREKIDFIPISASYPRHFMLMGERIVEEDNYILVNFYNEIIEENGKTIRYLGKTKKAIIPGHELEESIQRSGMKIVKSVTKDVDQTFVKGIRYLYCRLSGSNG